MKSRGVPGGKRFPPGDSGGVPRGDTFPQTPLATNHAGDPYLPSVRRLLLLRGMWVGLGSWVAFCWLQEACRGAKDAGGLLVPPRYLSSKTESLAARQEDASVLSCRGSSTRSGKLSVFHGLCRDVTVGESTDTASAFGRG